MTNFEDEIKEKLEKIPPELRNVAMLSGFLSLETSKLFTDTNRAKNDLRKQIYDMVDELEVDSLISVYSLLMSMTNLISTKNNLKRSVKKDKETSNSNNKRFLDEAYEKGFEKGKSLRIKELKKMRE